jgi:hypothetical protein
MQTRISITKWIKSPWWDVDTAQDPGVLPGLRTRLYEIVALLMALAELPK